MSTINDQNADTPISFWSLFSLRCDWILPRLLARLFKRGQRTGGGDHLTECEERVHVLDSTEAICLS